MTSWANRVRVESGAFLGGGWGEIKLRGKFDSKEEFERAYGYMENLVNVGIKADMLDALREELAATEAKLAATQLELDSLRVVARNALARWDEALPILRGWDEVSRALGGPGIGISLDTGHNNDEDPNAQR